MAVKIGHAVYDENNKAVGGTAGDQTGKEICGWDWYNKPWTAVIRAKDGKVAEKIAHAMEQACANNKIGYDQKQRTTLYTQAKAVNWDLSKITTACECDCSSLVAVCVNAAGIKVSKDIYTGNEQDALNSTGAFEVLTTSKYIGSSTYLERGDILLGKGHTAVVLTNGTKVTSTTKSIDELAQEVLDGKHGSGEARKASLGNLYNEVQAKVNELLKNKTTRVHTVVKGDTLWAIAKKYLGNGGRYPEIMKLNGLKSTTLHANQKLKIPNK